MKKHLIKTTSFLVLFATIGIALTNCKEEKQPDEIETNNYEFIYTPNFEVLKSEDIAKCFWNGNTKFDDNLLEQITKNIDENFKLIAGTKIKLTVQGKINIFGEHEIKTISLNKNASLKSSEFIMPIVKKINVDSIKIIEDKYYIDNLEIPNTYFISKLGDYESLKDNEFDELYVSYSKELNKASAIYTYNPLTDDLNTKKFYLNDKSEEFKNLKREDILEISTENGFSNTAPGTIRNIKYTKNKEDIDYIYNYLNSPLRRVSKSQFDIEGGSFVTYCIFTNNSYINFNIKNGTIKLDNKVYEFIELDRPILNEYKTINKFLTYDNNYCVYDTNKKIIGEYNNLDEFEFINSDIIKKEKERVAYATPTYFGEISIYNEKLFSYNNLFYEIVGNADFSEIIGKLDEENEK